MKILKSELEYLRRHEANAIAYEQTVKEIIKTIRSVEGDIHGDDPEKAAWAEGWVACAVAMAQGLKQAKTGPVRALSDEVFPF
jgi:hypothetical protein